MIWLAAFATLKPGDEVLILGPTFGEYERASRLMAATPRQWNALPAAGFPLDVPEITRRLGSAHFRAVFLCNPNNPTGQVLSNAAIRAWADAHPNTLFIVDEAYLAFVPGLESVLPAGRPNLLVLRSMTKDYALAGLRLGYAAGDERLIRALKAVRPAWNVNALAQAAGAGERDWRAYLSTTAPGGEAGVNARDRIGKGPWKNARGEVMARGVDDLHSPSVNITKQTALTEKGEGVSGRGDPVNLHDILTGSDPEGNYSTAGGDTTCANWTSSGEGSAIVGHHDRIGPLPDNWAKSWNFSHQSAGCSQEALKSTGGNGLFYCFVAN